MNEKVDQPERAEKNYPLSESCTFLRKSTDLTRRDRLKSAPYLRLKNIQRTTIGNISKNYFFSKKKLKFFFRKKVFFKKSPAMPKNSKRGHSGSLNVFTNRKLRKNARGYPLIESENFRKKSRIVPKKRKKSNERKPLVSHLLLEA